MSLTVEWTAVPGPRSRSRKTASATYRGKQAEGLLWRLGVMKGAPVKVGDVIELCRVDRIVRVAKQS